MSPMSTRSGTATIDGQILLSCSGTATCLICEEEHQLFAIVTGGEIFLALSGIGCNVVESLQIPPKIVAEVLPPARFGWAPPVRPWHRRRAAQMRIGRSPCARLPRGRVRAWRALKEKRRGWGFGA